MQSGTLGKYLTCVGAAVLCAAVYAGATPDDLRGVFKSIEGSDTVANPRSTTTPEGYLRYVAAPRGDSFVPSAAAKAAGSAEAIARSFLTEHAKAFGILDANVSFVSERVNAMNARSYVRLGQTYKGIPVYGATVTVQMKADGTLVSILSDIMREAPRLYGGTVSTTPALDGATAAQKAVEKLQGENPGRILTHGVPQLNIYAPTVIGAQGLVRLVYLVVVHSTDSTERPLGEQIIVDAKTGEIVLRLPRVYESKFRTIWDAEGVPGVDPGTLKRSEGAAAVGIFDVDNAYDCYGDTYDFYFTHHNRDSIDGNGLTMDATVRYCPNEFFCPYANAFWTDDLQRMYFGAGFVIDDVVGHELTHGVTSHTSGLIYFAESGALNESFSDIWGEFIDQTNGRGTDTAGVKWLMGEDVAGGAIRNMMNPRAFGDPDMYQGPGWIYDLSYDNGGVHINSGVCNKVCYLLTDGDTFNGFTVQPLGLDTVADLFYEVQTNLLGPSSDYPDFGDQLLQAAENIGLTELQTKQVANALFATEIKQFEGTPLRDFRAEGKSGDSRIALTWRNPKAGDFTGVTIRRLANSFPTSASDGTLVANVTNGNESVIDTPGGGAGADYYYGIFPNTGSAPFNEPLFARGTVGVTVDHFTQSFSDGTDLANSQITFLPTGPIPTTVSYDQLPDYYNYTTYTAHAATVAKIAPAFDGTLPVAKVDYYELPISDDGSVTLYPNVPIPFFGHFLSSLTVSANGYIAASATEYEQDPVNVTPTLSNHFELLRMSFLFCDLDPSSGGEVWARFLDDRIAVTFENVPSFDHSGVGGGSPGQKFTNTVQCEVFYGGQIRFTYLNLTAERAVVGLSDGNGLPLNAGDVLNGQPDPDPDEMDLSSLPESSPLELQPVAMQYIEPGDVVTFTASATSTAGTPAFSIIPLPDDLGVGTLTGATINPSTGAFSWNSDGFDPGVYGTLLLATAGVYTSAQPVAIVVVNTRVLPEARNLSLTPEEARDSQSLTASYSYHHPSLPEGPTVVYWFRNNELMPAFTNNLVLDDSATSPGQNWYFQVLPTTIQVGNIGEEDIFLRGAIVQSDTVTILPDLKVDTNGDGKVNSVDLQLVVRGLLGMGAPNVDPDVNGDGNEDVSDVQSTINFILTEKH